MVRPVRVLPALLLALGCTAAPAPPAPAASLPDSLLRRMTLEEKLGQLTMASGEGDQTGPRVPAGTEDDVRAGRVGAFLNLWGSDTARRLQRIAVEESRLRIPLLLAQDVLHGWRTVFPMPLAEAASFDPALAERTAGLAAREARRDGIHLTFAPMVDVARDPRWGRVVEGSGEDAFLGAAMAAARVRGFQGAGLSSAGALAATPKHFGAYGAAEGGRDYNTADVSERALWETYFPPFQAAIDAGARVLMPSFNDLAGVPGHANRWLLTDILRERWRFEGVVVSDWAAVAELMAHGVAAGPADAARMALLAGVDMEMSTDLYRSELPALVRSGAVPIEAVDRAVLRVLRLKQELGLFDEPYGPTGRPAAPADSHRTAAREAGRRAIVLLKNDTLAGGARALPLSRRLGTLAVIGPLADDRASSLGTWIGAGRAADAVTVLAGIREAVPDTRVLHATGATVEDADTSGFAEARRLAREADAVVLVLGERADMSGEAHSRASLELPGVQTELAATVLRAAPPGTPVAAVLMSGRPLALQSLAAGVPALLEAWDLGSEHGHAVADVLFGDHDPGGRLPATFPRVTGQVPLTYDHRPTGRPPADTGAYTTQYVDVPWTPLFPFGHGLSYTTFRYEELRVTARGRTGDTVAVQVRVTNEGSRAGETVVQLYLRDDAASVARPVRMLRGFERVGLGAGERRQVRFELRPEHFALYDRGMRRVVEPGTFTVYVGASSAAGLQARLELSGDTLLLAEPPPPPRE